MNPEPTMELRTGSPDLAPAPVPSLAERQDRAAAPLGVRLDWREYFAQFQAVHGGNPVEAGGRLLYADGWAYSRSDYAGPEYPPPACPLALRGLQLTYWKARYAKLRADGKALMTVVEELDAEQRRRSAPLQQLAVYADETGQRRLVSAPVNVDDYRGRLLSLKADELAAKARLRELSLTSG